MTIVVGGPPTAVGGPGPAEQPATGDSGAGRLMLDAMIAGTHAPEVLAGLAKGRRRAKLPALRQASAGRFRTAHPNAAGQRPVIRLPRQTPAMPSCSPELTG
jgi:hypothetical protein